jgi:hypothetical protein
VGQAITKNGLIRLSAPSAPDLTLWKTDKRIEDPEILKILEQPLAKPSSGKSKSKKKKKKAAKKVAEEESEESSEEE